MTYRERERKKAISIRDSMFKDPGNGIFFGKERDFVLNEPALNLWEGIREDAKEYFKRNKIPWWKGDRYEPTGHLLSSQVACLNHLYYLRHRKDLATAVLQGIDSTIAEAVEVDEGYVEFEFIGEDNYLGEKSHTRGANSTSIDAVMIGMDSSGRKKFFLIEWKYTEDYGFDNKYIAERASVYDQLIKAEGSPFVDIQIETFYYEPFYQLMRQTLLGAKLVENKDHGCVDYHHLHVIPKKNTELLNRVTSPYLKGDNITAAWKSTMKNPDKYQVVSPEELLSPCLDKQDCRSFMTYLSKRYW